MSLIRRTRIATRDGHRTVVRYRSSINTVFGSNRRFDIDRGYLFFKIICVFALRSSTRRRLSRIVRYTMTVYSNRQNRVYDPIQNGNNRTNCLPNRSWPGFVTENLHTHPLIDIGKIYSTGRHIIDDEKARISNRVSMRVRDATRTVSIQIRI